MADCRHDMSMMVCAHLVVSKVVARKEVCEVAACDFCCIALRAGHVVWFELLLIGVLHNRAINEPRARAPSLDEHRELRHLHMDSYS